MKRLVQLTMKFIFIFTLSILISCGYPSSQSSELAYSSSSMVFSSSVQNDVSSSSMEILSSSSLIGICSNTYGVNTMVDCRDQHAYSTIRIGTQTWMAENLAYLPSVNAMKDYSSTEAKYYVYDYNGTIVSEAKSTSSYLIYGVFYNWVSAMAGLASSTTNPSGVRGVCPPDWHLPSDAEWSTLENYVGGSIIAGSQLKANSALWFTKKGSDNYGFSALPAGYCFGTDCYGAGGSGFWWTATESELNSEEAVCRNIHDESLSMSLGKMNKYNGFSVRCIRND